MERTIQIEHMIEEYGSGLPGIDVSHGLTGGPLVSESVVLLTGTTGTIGAEILFLLLNNNKVRKIYAFNRPSRGPSIEARHKATFTAKGLNSDLLHSANLIFVEGDTSLPNLGLAANIYGELRISVTLIIHNAWSVNVAQPLENFRPLIHGTRNLIDMALSSPHALSLRFLFISSHSAAQSWDRERGHVPEEILKDARYGIGLGYGESKFVAEQIISHSGLRSTILRLGQICGRVANGSWSTSEWVPKLIKSSVTLGALPRIAGVVSWVPLEAAANCTLDIAFSKEQPPHVLNIWHPRPVHWNTLMEFVKSALSHHTGQTLPLISLSDWESKLERESHHKDLHKIPLVKLTATVRLFVMADAEVIKSGRTDVEQLGFHTCATQKACAFSPTLRDLQPLGALHARRWVEYWCTSGFIGDAPLRSRL